jgi:L-fuculose-phosphate aldolase
VSLAPQRRALADSVRWLVRRGLLAGTSGNVSSRTRGGLLITPTGIAWDDVAPGAMVALDRETGDDRNDGNDRRRGGLLPSSEWRLHRDLYATRPDVGAIVHTHSTFATALACLRRPIPSFHYMVAKAGGADIRCARYATYGTAELSRNAIRALRDRRACLLANHGLVTVGADLAAARQLAEEVEAICAQYLAARAGGAPVLLPAREMRVVARRFASYGQPHRG